MTNNNGFKNALIGLKTSSDPSWPLLDESCQKSKKTKKHGPGDKHNDPDLVISQTQEEAQSTPVRNETSDVLNYGNEDFPELSCSTIKTKSTVSAEKLPLVSDESRSIVNIPKTSILPHSKKTKLRNCLVNIPILSLIKKTSCKKKRILCKRVVLESSSLCGNKLDSDKPLRRKGKVRLNKKKYDSQLRKEIILSRQIKKKHSSYNQQILKVKSRIPQFINCSNELNVELLSSILQSIKINEKEYQLSESDPLDKLVSNDGCDKSGNNQFSDIAKSILHSKSFRDYCNNIVNDPLLKKAQELITILRNFQDRLHAKDPSKAFAKRRYLCGFKETKKFLVADRVKLIIVATDLQLELDLPSGRVLKEIRSLCHDKSIPLAFVGRGNQIGYWTLKRRRISIVSVLNYEGAEDHFNQLIESWKNCKKLYETLLQQIELYLAGNRARELDVLHNVEEEMRENIISKLSLEGENKCAN